MAFASPFVYMVWNLSFDLTSWLPDLRAGQAPRLTIAGATAIPFVMLIVIYGVFIPNTWQRCAALVGGAALLPVLITAGVGLTDARL